MKIPIQNIVLPFETGIKLKMLRLDLIDPNKGGNKWFKLKYNLKEASKLGHHTLLTFGGAYSNHIAAVAALGHERGFQTIGVIRGEELNMNSNHTLKEAAGAGMKLHFVSREQYLRRADPIYAEELKNEFGDFYFLPEGGTNALAVKGCEEIPDLIDIPFNLIVCPVGTGGTLAGLINALKPGQRALGFSVLKGAEFLKDDIMKWIFDASPVGKWSINHDFHFGGYGKSNDQLLAFIDQFKKLNGISLDRVYTGKMMFGLMEMIKKNQIPSDSTIVAVHTGGLQSFGH